ncbi:hypothetical protein QJS66_12540 [Kocuria rhizophila]|nr:hypothetical protein QJS66_12540 [Kocuria rhizophila]
MSQNLTRPNVAVARFTAFRHCPGGAPKWVERIGRPAARGRPAGRSEAVAFAQGSDASPVTLPAQAHAGHRDRGLPRAQGERVVLDTGHQHGSGVLGPRGHVDPERFLGSRDARRSPR